MSLAALLPAAQRARLVWWFVERLELSSLHAPPAEPRGAARDRYAPLPGDPPEIAAWRPRMGSEAAKAVDKQRAATAECINARARNRGLTRFLVRGLAKVRAVVLMHGF